MSAKTLRMFVALGVVFAAFIYGFSAQLAHMMPVKSPEEGLLGGPIAGLTHWQLEKFEEGRTLFCKRFTEQEGLGPLYNAASCADCHGGLRTTGGAGAERTDAITMIANRRSPSNAAGLTGSAGRSTAPAGSPLLSSDKKAALANKKESKVSDVPGHGPNAKVSHTSTEEKDNELSKIDSKELDYLVDEGGPVLLRKSITDLKNSNLASSCKIAPMSIIPKGAGLHSTRYTPQIYGLGFIDAFPDLMIRYEAGKQSKLMKRDFGRSAQVESIYPFWGSVGKFGSKAQEANLELYVAHEMSTEIGISNPFYRHSITSKGPDKVPDCLKSVGLADPNDDGKILNKITFYLQTLAAPPRATITPEAQQGEAVFDKLGCAVCHVAEHKTPPKVVVINPDGPAFVGNEIPATKTTPVQVMLSEQPLLFELRALENKKFFPYSDFLVHDMGPALADGLAQQGAKGGEWRTTPLWGLRYRKFYMHDGRASALAEAISMHGGQGAAAAQSYAKLSETDKTNLLAFLNSL